MSYKKLVSTVGLSKSDWLQQRRAGIGGSDVAAIAGISKYANAFKVYIDRVEPETQEEQETNEAMYWGTKLEDIVAEEFTVRTGIKTKRCNYILQNEQYPFMLANVDRMIVGERAGLECKTGSEYTFSNWGETNIPDSYMLQIQHYMAVTGFDVWYVAVLIGGNKFKHYKIDRDQQMIDYITTLEENFWLNNVQKQIPPLLDGSDAASEWIKEKYAKSEEGTTMDLYGVEEYLHTIEEAKEIQKEYEAKQKEAENIIKNMMGETETANFQNYKITWKNQPKTSIDTTLLKAEMPGIYNQYSRVTQGRRFLITDLNKKK